MPDYGCHPLWHYKDDLVGEIDPRSLKISEELILELSAWALEYDKTLNQNYPPDSGFESEESETRFIGHGLKLARKLKNELNGVSVFYFDNRVQHVQVI